MLPNFYSMAFEAKQADGDYLDIERKAVLDGISLFLGLPSLGLNLHFLNQCPATECT